VECSLELPGAHDGEVGNGGVEKYQGASSLEAESGRLCAVTSGAHLVGPAAAIVGDVAERELGECETAVADGLVITRRLEIFAVTLDGRIEWGARFADARFVQVDRKSTRLNSSHG